MRYVLRQMRNLELAELSEVGYVSLRRCNNVERSLDAVLSFVSLFSQPNVDI